MLGAYLNQTVLYAPLLGSDNRGQPVYGDVLGLVLIGLPNVVILPCRRQVQTREVLTADKRVVQVEYVYHLLQQVKEGDSLDGRRVQMVEPMTGLGGAVIGYKAVV